MKLPIDAIRRFRDERDFKQFHTPENLAKSISIEAGELLEHFQWDGHYELAEVGKELADVVTYCAMMADVLGLDLHETMLKKLAENKRKYPVEKSKGVSTKYTDLK